MEEETTHVQDACPNCGSVDNETDATFCQTCGIRLDSALIQPPAPPHPCEPGKTIGGRFVVRSLLWTAPTYNSYDAIQSSTSSPYTIIEQRLGLNDQVSN